MTWGHTGTSGASRDSGLRRNTKIEVWPHLAPSHFADVQNIYITQPRIIAKYLLQRSIIPDNQYIDKTNGHFEGDKVY